ncbi:hypothetical protein AWC38_SpisGene4851 [Stylophora pistillata]|uniref:Uncharacterized protein n=1 Tax=Stylophora pistillata TaxID=50429 RepID=A0A2B4SNF6_STYPI|nr:hypothetical protein AWC38_SpisGene4851 [Stylophora pistillata]
MWDLASDEGGTFECTKSPDNMVLCEPEEIQELLIEEERKVDSQVYDNLYNEVHLRGAVQKWMIEASLRVREEKDERRSSKSTVKTRSSKFSRASTTPSKAKAVQAKVRQAELEAGIAQLHQVEAARKEAERVKLEAEFAAAAAASKVYEDAIKEDEEQYLGSDDPDIDGTDPSHWPEPKRHPEGFKPSKNTCQARTSDLDLEHPSDPAAKQLKDSLNPETPEFISPITPWQQGVGTSGEEALKSSVVGGPKIRNGDRTALLVLSEKLQNCYWAMIELNSNELDCSTNLQQIYDRLPDPLPTKWRRSANSYRDKTGGREPSLKELSAVITAESQTENDPVYGRSSHPTTRVGSGFRP